MAPKERAFSIRTTMLILTVGSGIVAMATALVVGWLSYRESQVPHRAAEFRMIAKASAPTPSASPRWPQSIAP
jgi:hypothetical protein